jgi:formylglycine-generating enzyme required for sulfatase activity
VIDTQAAGIQPPHPIPAMNPSRIAPSATALILSLSQASAVDFKTEIQPILETHCVRCHNPKGTDYEKGDTDVDLSTKEAAFEVKSTIVPGNSAKSKIYTTTVLADDAKKLMPPKNKVTGELARLAPAETELLKKWVDEGAQWPDDAGTLIARKKQDANGSGKAEKESTLVGSIHERITKNAVPADQGAMKAYTKILPGSDVAYEMLPIPGGKFKMGSPDGEKGRQADEGPVREVDIAPFWMGKCEVTWNEYELFMYPNEEKKTRESKQLPADLNQLTDSVTRPTQPYVEMSFGMGKDGFPAISMTQHGANKYCQWLSAKTGEFYRLPTEAEWEYACRAGTQTAYYWGDDATPMGEYAWYGRNSDFKYQKVGRKKPNPWGLHDMIGNVIEWCIDQYAADAYAALPAANPWKKATEPYPHVARGGSWDDDDVAKLRAAARRKSDPSWKIQDPQLPKSIWYHTDAQFLGFRIVRPLKTPSKEEMQAYWNSGVEKDNPALEKPE